MAPGSGQGVLSRPMAASDPNRSRASRGRLGELLRAGGLVSDEQLAEAVDRAHAKGTRLGSALVELGHVEPNQVAEALARQHGVVPCRDEDLKAVPAHIAAILPAVLARSLCAVPVRVVGGHMLMVAMRDPGDEDAVTELWRQTGLRIRPVVAPEERLLQAIEHLYARGDDVVAPPRIARGSMSPPVRGAMATRPPPIQRGRSLLDAGAPRRGWFALSTLAVALAVGASLAYYGLRAELVTSAVPAIYASTHVGLRAAIGDGWQRVDPLRHVEQRAGAPVASEILVRGDTERPGEVLGLARLQADAPITSWVTDFASAGLPFEAGWWHCHNAKQRAPGCVVELSCEPSPAIYDDGGTCGGVGYRNGVRYQVTVWFWRTGGDLQLVMWAPRASSPQPIEGAMAVARSLRTL
jgi:hypothetical protein